MAFRTLQLITHLWLLSTRTICDCDVYLLYKKDEEKQHLITSSQTAQCEVLYVPRHLQIILFTDTKITATLKR